MKQYETPVAEILLFAAEDIITTSPADPDVESPKVPFGYDSAAPASDWQ